jgi:uncharacterized protein (TIGR04255 family)
VRDQYPLKANRFLFEGHFSAGDQLDATSTQRLLGFAFTSDDGKQILQTRLDGFTLSRLRPYTSWPELRTESKRLWDLYRDIAQPLKITRVAVRYVNQIDIPVQSFDYKDYFRTFPEISSDLPQGLLAFNMQLQLPQEEFRGLLILNQASLWPQKTPGIHSVILDLDAFKPLSEPISEESLWDLLETLRNCKNQFFEGSITDNTRRLFGKREEY